VLAFFQVMASELVDGARVSRALRVISEQRGRSGDNVKPLSSLRCDGADLAHYLRLADHVRKLWREMETRRQDAAPAPEGEVGETAQRLLVGILAPAGGGKSTLVELLKLLLSSPAGGHRRRAR
jgi:pantothenate kinase